MTDEDLNKLASKLTKSLATKEDISGVKEDISGVKEGIKRLEKKIDNVDQKTDFILKFAQEIDETTTDHEKRLEIIETIPAIAHQIKK